MDSNNGYVKAGDEITITLLEMPLMALILEMQQGTYLEMKILAQNQATGIQFSQK